MSQSGRIGKAFGAIFTQQRDADIVVGTGALGAIGLSKGVTLVKTTGAASGTLPASVAGHTKLITVQSFAGNYVLTPSSLVGGKTTITFTAVGQSVHLVYTGTAWSVISNNGATIA